MELTEHSVCICETAASGTVQAMADGDIIVPDIKPDILKLLQVDAEACVTDRYVENGRLTVCGRVDYTVLYLPDRENEKIRSIKTSMEFRQLADAKGAGEDSFPIVSASVERVEFNAVNSRKIRLRAIISIGYEVCCIREIGLCTDCMAENAECRRKLVKFESAADISEHEFSIKEAIEVPSGQNSVNEILKTDVCISDTEYKTVTGKAIVKGCARICVLYTDDEGGIHYIESETPFTEVFDIDGAGEDAICDIEYSTAGVMTAAEADSDGDMRIVTVDIDVIASVKATEETEEEILSDCFVPYRSTKCGYETTVLTETVERPSGQYNVREVIDFPSGVPGVSGVYNVITNAVVTKSEIQRKKLLCEGRIETFILYLTDTAENPVYSIKKDIKFSYMLECENDCSDCMAKVKVNVRHISYNLNAAGALELRCLLEIDAKLMRQNSISNISSVECSERESDNSIIICFVKNGDTVWDIAKRYGVPQKSIIESNDMDENAVLTGGEKLFIPPF